MTILYKLKKKTKTSKVVIVSYFPTLANMPSQTESDISLRVFTPWQSTHPSGPHPLWLCERLEFKGRVSCARVGLPFPFPILPCLPPPLWHPLTKRARMEGCTAKVTGMDFLWFDSMKRSEEGTTKWQRGLHATLSGTGVLASSWNGTREPIGGPSQWNNPGPVGSLTNTTSVTLMSL